MDGASGAVPGDVGTIHAHEPRADTRARSSGFLRDTTVTFISRIAAVMLAVGLASATARLLGPAGKGELSTCLVFAHLLVLGLGFGIEMGCAYYAGSGREPVGAILGVQLVTFAVTSALIVTVGAALLASSLPFVQKAPTSAFRMAIVYALAELFFVYMTVLYMGLGRLTLYNLARVGGQGATLAVLTGACWFFPTSELAVVAYACGAASMGLWLAVDLTRGRLLRQITVAWGTIAACYRYGIRYYFGKLSTLTTMQMGVIVIAFLGSKEDVGIFAAALGLISPLSILPDTLNVVLLPRVLKEREQLAALVVKSCRAAVLITAVAGLLVAVLSRPIVLILLSGSFLPAVGPLLVLIPGALVRCISKVLVPYFNGIGRPEFNSAALGLALVINFSLTVALLPRWGLIGAAAATTLGFLAEAALAMFLFVSTSDQKWREFIPGPADLRTIAGVLRRRS